MKMYSVSLNSGTKKKTFEKDGIILCIYLQNVSVNYAKFIYKICVVQADTTLFMN